MKTARLARVGLIALFAMLAACAESTVTSEGEALLASGQTEEGLRKLQQAAIANPNDATARAKYLRSREQAVNAWLLAGDAAIRAAQRAAAEADFKRVLHFDPSNAVAIADMQVLARAEARSASFKAAKELVDHGNIKEARYKLRGLLAEDPSDTQSQTLLDELDVHEGESSSESKLDEAYKKPISIEFHDATLRQIFEVLSKSSGLSFVFDKDVKSDQKATVFLKETTVADAVRAVLLTNQLKHRSLDGKTILIYPDTPAKVRDYQPLSVKSFFLSTSDAKTVANTLKTVLKVKDIVVDEKQNMVIIHDTPEAIRIAEKLVALHEMPEPEVMLDVEILEIQRSRLLDLGVQYPSQISLAPLTDANGNVTLQELRSLDSAGIAVTVSPLNINANRTLSDANILANPRIRTRNHEKARVQVGERLPNVTTTIASAGFASENIQYIDVGLKLDVEPSIYPDNEVAIKIALEVSSVLDQITTKSGSTAYEIGTRNASTVLRLKDGENQILAGLINDQESRSAQRLPGLGDLPILSRIFGNQQNSTDRTEIVLSITPHLIRNLRRPSLSAGEFDTGTEGSVGSSGGSGQSPGIVPLAPIATPGASASATPAKSAENSSFSSQDASGAATIAGLPVASGDPGSTAPAVAGGAGITAAGGVTPTSSNTTLSFGGPTQATMGAQFTISLQVQPGQPLTSVPTTLAFDPKVLEVIGVAAGSFVSAGGAGTFSSKVDPVNGLITINAITGESGGNSESGPLMTVTFQAIKESTGSQIQVQSFVPLNSSGQAAPTTLPSPDTIVIAS